MKRFHLQLSKTILVMSLLAPFIVNAVTAGKVIVVKGSVMLKMRGKQVKARRGMSFGENDTFTLGQKAKAQIRFTDGTLVTLNPGTKFSVLDYRYAKNGTKNVNKSFLASGSIRSLTGALTKNNKGSYKIKTNVATIGIRGTDFLASIGCSGRDCKPELKVGVMSGLVYVAGKQLSPGAGDSFASITSSGNVTTSASIPSNFMQMFNSDSGANTLESSSSYADASSSTTASGGSATTTSADEGAANSESTSSDTASSDEGSADADSAALSFDSGGDSGAESVDVAMGDVSSGVELIQYNDSADVLSQTDFTPRVGAVSVSGSIFTDASPTEATVSGYLQFPGAVDQAATTQISIDSSAAGFLGLDGPFNSQLTPGVGSVNSNTDAGESINWGTWSAVQPVFSLLPDGSNAESIGCTGGIGACLAGEAHYINFLPASRDDNLQGNFGTSLIATIGLGTGTIDGNMRINGTSAAIDPLNSVVTVDIDVATGTLNYLDFYMAHNGAGDALYTSSINTPSYSGSLSSTHHIYGFNSASVTTDYGGVTQGAVTGYGDGMVGIVENGSDVAGSFHISNDNGDFAAGIFHSR